MQWDAEMGSLRTADVFPESYVCRSQAKKWAAQGVLAGGRRRQWEVGLDKQNNNFARESGFSVRHFFAVTVHDCDVKMPNFTF